MKTAILVAVPLAVAIPAVLLLLAWWRRVHQTEFTRLGPRLPLKPLPAPAQWVLQLLVLCAFVTSLYTVTLNLEYHNEKPDILTLETIQSIPVVIQGDVNSSLAILRADAKTIWAPDSPEWAIVNNQTVPTPDLSFNGTVSAPPDFHLPPLLSSIESTNWTFDTPPITVVPNRTEAARLLSQIVRSSADMASLGPVISAIVVPSNDSLLNQTAAATAIGAILTNASTQLNTYLSRSMAYDSNAYGTTATIVAPTMVQRFAQARTGAGGNVLGPSVFYGNALIGQPLRQSAVDYPVTVNFSTTANVTIYNPSMRGGILYKDYGYQAWTFQWWVGIWAIDLYNPLPGPLGSGCLHLVDGFDLTRPGEPDWISTYSIWQFDFKGSRAAEFIGPTFIYGNLWATSILTSTIFATNFTITGTFTYVRVRPISDGRLKTDVTPIMRGFFLKHANPVSFRWLADSDTSRKQAGFLAQDVQEKFPACAAANDAGQLGIDPTCMLAYTTASAKNLVDRIDLMEMNAERFYLSTATRIGLVARKFVAAIALSRKFSSRAI